MHCEPQNCPVVALSAAGGVGMSGEGMSGGEAGQWEHQARTGAWVLRVRLTAAWRVVLLQACVVAAARSTRVRGCSSGRLGAVKNKWAEKKWERARCKGRPPRWTLRRGAHTSGRMHAPAGVLRARDLL